MEEHGIVSRLTKEVRQNRSECFTAFLRGQGLAWVLEPRCKYRFVVYRGRELVKVVFSDEADILITGHGGQLKQALQTWLTQEYPGVRDNSDSLPLKSLEEEYGSLLLASGSAPAHRFPERVPDGALPLSPGDHPFAEVADRLGYRIFLCASTPRYLITSGEQIIATGDRFSETFAELFRTRQHS